MGERDRSPEKDNRAGMAAATLKLIVAFLYACRRWMSVEQREKRRTSENYRPWSTWPRGGGLEIGGGRGWRGRLDHDCTARQGIMDTIIRKRLEVLVIFLLPPLARTVIHIFVVG